MQTCRVGTHTWPTAPCMRHPAVTRPKSAHTESYHRATLAGISRPLANPANAHSPISRLTPATSSRSASLLAHGVASSAESDAPRHIDRGDGDSGALQPVSG